MVYALTIRSVSGYDEATGILQIEHKYACQASQNTAAKVDMNAVVGAASNSCFEVGSWINVIGYVTMSRMKARKKQNLGIKLSRNDDEASVQAVLVWSAVAILVSRY